MGFFVLGKAHTGPLYGVLPSADIGQMVYCAPCHTAKDRWLTLYHELHGECTHGKS